MSDEKYKAIRITRGDLINWIDRPPSNEDIELCDYLVNALDNQYKYYKEIQRLKKVIEEVRKTLINSKKYKMANAMNLNDKQSVLVELLQILDKVKDVK